MRRMLGLRPVGMILYKHLFLTFGFLTRKGVKHICFEKDYNDLCGEWLVGHTPLRYLSEIRRHIGSHLDDLVAVGLLESAAIKKRSGKDGGGFKIVCRPGAGFREDYPLFHETAFAHLPEQSTQQPEEYDHLEVLAHFHSRCGRDHQHFRSKEVSDSQSLLALFGKKEIIDLIDYALANSARGANPQVFGYVLGYVEPWKLVKDKRAEKQAHVAATLAIHECQYCDTGGSVEVRG